VADEPVSHPASSLPRSPPSLSSASCPARPTRSQVGAGAGAVAKLGAGGAAPPAARSRSAPERAAPVTEATLKDDAGVEVGSNAAPEGDGGGDDDDFEKSTAAKKAATKAAKKDAKAAKEAAKKRATKPKERAKQRAQTGSISEDGGDVFERLSEAAGAGDAGDADDADGPGCSPASLGSSGAGSNKSAEQGLRSAFTHAKSWSRLAAKHSRGVSPYALAQLGTTVESALTRLSTVITMVMVTIVLNGGGNMFNIGTAWTPVVGLLVATLLKGQSSTTRERFTALVLKCDGLRGMVQYLLEHTSRFAAPLLRYTTSAVRVPHVVTIEVTPASVAGAKPTAVVECRNMSMREASDIRTQINFTGPPDLRAPWESAVQNHPERLRMFEARLRAYYLLVTATSATSCEHCDKSHGDDDGGDADSDSGRMPCPALTTNPFILEIFHCSVANTRGSFQGFPAARKHEMRRGDPVACSVFHSRISMAQEAAALTLTILYIMGDVVDWGNRVSSSPSLTSTVGDGYIVRNERLNADIASAMKVFPPLLGAVGNLDDFVGKATKVRRSLNEFYGGNERLCDADRLLVELDADALAPDALQILPVTSPVKLYQLVLILVRLRRIQERETMAAHHEDVDDDRDAGDAVSGGGNGSDDQAALVAALREEIRADRERFQKDREDLKNQLAEQARIMTEQVIRAIRGAPARSD